MRKRLDQGGDTMGTSEGEIQKDGKGSTMYTAYGNLTCYLGRKELNGATGFQIQVPS